MDSGCCSGYRASLPCRTHCRICRPALPITPPHPFQSRSKGQSITSRMLEVFSILPFQNHFQGFHISLPLSVTLAALAPIPVLPLVAVDFPSPLLQLLPRPQRPPSTTLSPLPPPPRSHTSLSPMLPPPPLLQRPLHEGRKKISLDCLPPL